MKLTITLPIILFAFDCFSQETTVLLKGLIISEQAPVANVHVYNMSAKQGVISNDLGKFEITVAKHDTLYISSLEYEKKYVLISEKNMQSEEILIELFPLVNELDEIFLRHLTGDLKFDSTNKPKDTLPAIGYIFNPKDLYKKLPNDSYELSKRPNAISITDPIGPLSGGVGLPNKRYQKEQRLDRELNRKREFPEKLKNEFGIKYFTEQLKIPENQINLFISYCEYREIYEKYYNNQVLEVIEILKEESINYNAIEKN